MFGHNFKYAFKTLIKNKMLIFWTFAFPLILGTFFYMAFSDIEKNEKLEVFDIAIVDTPNFYENTAFVETFKTLGDSSSEDQLFSISYVNLEEAKSLLSSKKIVGYLLIEDTPKVVVLESGINETILQFVVDEILEQEQIIQDYIMKNGPNFMMDTGFDYHVFIDNIIKHIDSYEINIHDISNKKMSYTMIEYYTLIAMTCLYGGILGMTSMNQNLANMSNKGKRVSISPVPKGLIVISSLLASFVVQLIGLALLFIYIIFALHVDFGNSIHLVVLLAIIGSLAGLTLGVVISSCIKAQEATKIGIIIAITMLGSFLSGMMGITMKYVVDKNIPILNLINPANMITDGFYALYYYDTFNRYWFNVISLLLFSLIMIILAFISLRRQKYDSI